MNVYDVKVSGYVRHNGVTYAPGDVIRGLAEREAQRLAKLGVAASVAPSDGEPSPGPGKAPSDPNTPWGLVSLSATEAAERIGKVDDLKFLRAVEALEELRDKPRATVLRAIEARRQELEPSVTPPAAPPFPQPTTGHDDPTDPQQGNVDDGGNSEPGGDRE